MAGREQAPIRGRIISVSPCGWHSLHSCIPGRGCIRRVLPSNFRARLHRESWSTMAVSALTKRPMTAGTTSHWWAHRVELCVSPERARVPPPAPRSGIFRAVRVWESMPYTSASRRSARRPKARSTRSVMQASRTRRSSTRQCSLTFITSRMVGCISANTTLRAQAMNISSCPIAHRMKLPRFRISSSVWTRFDSCSRVR